MTGYADPCIKRHFLQDDDGTKMVGQEFNLCLIKDIVEKTYVRRLWPIGHDNQFAVTLISS